MATLATGARYDPLTDSWTDLVVPLVLGRSSHTAVWTGQAMVIWGGKTSSAPLYLNDGAWYDPISEDWADLPSAGAPAARAWHTAVWTGTSMLVWGGGTLQSPYLDTGGRLDLETWTWTPMSTDGAPSARRGHTMVWTGDSAVVWGGFGPLAGEADTGGRYDPATDTWSATAVSGAPAPRSEHSAVWTGDRMIVWGGVVDLYTQLDTGGTYDPVSDSWTALPVAGAPHPRTRHTAVWADGSLVVWGGRFTDTSSGTNLWRFLGDGGVYEAATETWSATSLVDAPIPQEGHRAVWTGDAMLLWGGGQSNVGGSYRTGWNVDRDLDSWTRCDGDCNDQDPSSYPGAPELCDGLDNDCDGTADGFATTCGVGQCASSGFCAAGADSCSPGPAVAEACDNLDNDCDGIVDGQATACGIGGCAAAGTCSAGVDSCVPGDPSPEVCNGIDDDCDGSTPAGESDDDGDGSRLCDGDCAPADPTVYPDAPEINDGRDNQCPGDAGAGIVDEVSGMATMSAGSQYCWPGQAGAATYKVVRSGTAKFDADCVAATTAASCWYDPEDPPPEGVLHYLVQASTPNAGSWGYQGDGTERSVPCAGETNCSDGQDEDGDGVVDCDDVADCFRDPSCGNATFEFQDLPGDDLVDDALQTFFSGLPLIPSDHLLFSLTRNGVAGFEWCAERADLYRDWYLAFAATGGIVVSGPWYAWYREGTGTWSGAVQTEFPNFYGDQCLGSYSWCAEAGLGDQGLAIVPADTASCEAVDLIAGCGDGTWELTIRVGVDRMVACGF